MIVPTHLDMFANTENSLVLAKCHDILDRVRRFTQNQLERINFEIAGNKARRKAGTLSDGGIDPEWKKDNPPIISSVLQSHVLTVSWFSFEC